MRDYPLLDLRDAWQAAQRCLKALHYLAETLYEDSARTWADMDSLRKQIAAALDLLSVMPQGILDGIAHDEADLDAIFHPDDASRQ